MNIAHKEMIIEVFKKSDLAIFDRCKQILGNVEKIENQIKKIKENADVEIKKLEQDVKLFEKDLDNLMNKTFYKDI